MLKFVKSAPYIPDPAPSRPLITEEERARAARRPIEIVPFHCKPWVDGQRIGWTLFYGYVTPVTVRGLGDGKIAVDNLDQLVGETNQPQVIHQFAPHNFGLGTGYTFVTPPRKVSLVIPATDPPPGLVAIPAVIETDWYPRQTFLVFHTPAEGEAITLDHGMELARIVVVPRTQPQPAQALGEDERVALERRLVQYRVEQEKAWASGQSDPDRMTSLGEPLTHTYREWSRKYRRG